MRQVSSLILDLDDSIARGHSDKRQSQLRQVTELFLKDVESLSDEQIDLFDVVIARLASAIEVRARAELAERLAGERRAPPGVIRTLAHDEIEVARPVLARSERLTDEDLVAVVLAKGRDHMLAISERDNLAEPVTDVLVRRGDRVVVHAVAGNPGARFSKAGLATLVDRSRADMALQGLLGRRTDIPEHQMRQILAIAAETARQRLTDSVPDASRPAVDRAVESSKTRMEAALVPGGRDYSRALAVIDTLIEKAPLTEADVASFAAQMLFEETVCAISRLVGLSLPAVERLFRDREAELLLVVGRAQDWSWETVRTLSGLRGAEAVQAHQLRKTQEIFEQLNPTTAQRVLHFLKVREATQRRAAESAAARQIRSKVK